MSHSIRKQNDLCGQQRLRSHFATHKAHSEDSGLTDRSFRCDSQRKKFQCGWCKFKAVFSATILRHHERKHSRLELDLVIVRQPGRPLTSPDKDGGGMVSSSRDACCHDNMYDDLELPRSSLNFASTEENSHTQTKRKTKRRRGSESRMALVKNCQTKTAKIHCDDILASGAWYIRKLMDKHSLSKVCFDSLAPHEFLDFTTRFKHQLKYVDSKRPNAEAKDLKDVANEDIVNLIRTK